MSNIIEDEGKSNYNHIINYLINQMNKSKDTSSENIPKEDKPVFLYEFFIFELYTPKEILTNMKQPLLSFRLFDFPTQTLEGKIDLEKECIIFNQGKSCFFEMEAEYLKEYLRSEPLYIMFIDMNHGDMQIIGSSKVNVSIFGYDNFLNYNNEMPKPRRNILKLFDNAMTVVAEFDIALMIRREYFSYGKYVSNTKFIRPETKVIINEPQTNESLITFNEPKKEKKEIKIEKTQIIQDMGNYKEASVNKIPQKIQPQQVNYDGQELLNPSSKNYTKNLKEMIDGSLNNPPPMFFHNKKQLENKEITVRIVRESLNESDLKNDEIKRQYVKKDKEIKSKETKVSNKKIPDLQKDVSYEKKMREVARYKTPSNQSANTSKRDVYFDIDSPKEDENEYIKLYSKLKIQNKPPQKVEKKEISTKSLIGETKINKMTSTNTLKDMLDDNRHATFKVSESNRFSINRSERIQESISVRDSNYEISSSVINIVPNRIPKYELK
jgi:hypothetical protein